jgi:hypothetical protein
MMVSIAVFLSQSMRQAAPKVSESFKVSHDVLEGIQATRERALTRQLNDDFSRRQVGLIKVRWCPTGAYQEGS